MSYSLGEHGHDKNNYPVNKIQTIWEQEKKKHSKILLMKINNFFHVYHHDADIFHKEFDLLYMMGKVAMTGFPQSCLDRYTSELKEKHHEYHIVIVGNESDDYLDQLKKKEYDYSVIPLPVKKRKRPYHVYGNNDSAFYKWWKNIYQNDMDLYEKFSKPSIVRQREHIKWAKLRAYYSGLCDGRKRVNYGP